MKKILLMVLVAFTMNAQAQFNKASLQASGLTCSMCSKAVKVALEKVDFVEKVQVDIKNQRYNLTFKNDSKVDFDALSKAVQDAGFSVASFQVSANVSSAKLAKDEHLKIGDQYFHFLNGTNQTVDGEVTFSIVDKDYVSTKDFKKYSSMSKMACVKTGRMANCCTSAESGADSRIYHVII